MIALECGLVRRLLRGLPTVHIFSGENGGEYVNDNVPNSKRWLQQLQQLQQQQECLVLRGKGESCKHERISLRPPDSQADYATSLTRAFRRCQVPGIN